MPIETPSFVLVQGKELMQRWQQGSGVDAQKKPQRVWVSRSNLFSESSTPPVLVYSLSVGATLNCSNPVPKILMY